jgi:hypothetical protein
MRWMAALLGTLRALVIAGAASSGAAHAQQPQSADDAAWEAAQSAGTATAYQRYLEEFPAGQHAEEAFRLLIEETAPAAGDTSRFSVDIY